MLLIKRVLRTFMEAGILVVGSILAIILQIFLQPLLKDSIAIGFIGGLVLTIFALLFIQKKTRKWKLEYDTARWLASRTERLLHPLRSRYLRLIRRYLLWVPSACAVMVAFFFPVTTHFLHPCSHYLKHYRVPIPWTWTVFSPLGTTGEYSYTKALITIGTKSRYGVTPFWESRPSFSVAFFGSVGPNGAFEYNESLREQHLSGATDLSRRDFQLGKISLTCWQHPPASQSPVWRQVPMGFLEIDCSTPASLHNLDFYACFYGRNDHALLFYKVLEHVTPID